MEFTNKSPAFYFNEGSIVLIDPIELCYNDQEYVIPKGYESDGASVPRFLWRLLSPQYDPTTIVPSIIHDYIYENAIGTRENADKWYYHALRQNGYSWFKSNLTYYGLRLFGDSHWGTK